VARDPFTSAADADLGGLGRLAQRPLPLYYTAAELATAFQTESSVSVKLHPVSSLGLRCLAALSLQGGPDGPTYSGTTPRRTPRPAPRARLPRLRRGRRSFPTSRQKPTSSGRRHRCYAPR